MISLVSSLFTGRGMIQILTSLTGTTGFHGIPITFIVHLLPVLRFGFTMYTAGCLAQNPMLNGQNLGDATNTFFQTLY